MLSKTIFKESTVEMYACIHIGVTHYFFVYFSKEMCNKDRVQNNHKTN